MTDLGASRNTKKGRPETYSTHRVHAGSALSHFFFFFLQFKQTLEAFATSGCGDGASGDDAADIFGGCDIAECWCWFQISTIDSQSRSQQEVFGYGIAVDGWHLGHFDLTTPSQSLLIPGSKLRQPRGSKMSPSSMRVLKHPCAMGKTKMHRDADRSRNTAAPSPRAATNGSKHSRRTDGNPQFGFLRPSLNLIGALAVNSTKQPISGL